MIHSQRTMNRQRRVEITDALLASLVAEAEAGYDLDKLRPFPTICARLHLQYVGMFVHFALDQLWYASPDSLPDDPTDEQREDHLGCCPVCCAPCFALRGALTADLLDIWVGLWPDCLPGTAWWDPDKQQVRRDFLYRAWSRTHRLHCHDDIDDTDDDTDDPGGDE